MCSAVLQVYAMVKGPQRQVGILTELMAGGSLRTAVGKLSMEVVQVSWSGTQGAGCDAATLAIGHHRLEAALCTACSELPFG
jgi:hypothetical protein